MSEYINKNTGEVFEVEDTGLENLCDGDLNYIFKTELTKLTEQMGIGDKGKISIGVTIYCDEDKDGNTIYKAEADVKTTYPKTSVQDTKPKYLKEDGKVAQRKDCGLFEKEDTKDD